VAARTAQFHATTCEGGKHFHSFKDDVNEAAEPPALVDRNQQADRSRDGSELGLHESSARSGSFDNRWHCREKYVQIEPERAVGNVAEIQSPLHF
jgi:hypothetical protein